MRERERERGREKEGERDAIQSDCLWTDDDCVRGEQSLVPQRAQDHIQFHVDGSSCLLFSFQFYFNSISFLQERE